jgi:hypothetical protein
MWGHPESFLWNLVKDILHRSLSLFLLRVMKRIFHHIILSGNESTQILKFGLGNDFTREQFISLIVSGFVDSTETTFTDHFIDINFVNSNLFKGLLWESILFVVSFLTHLLLYLISQLL